MRMFPGFLALSAVLVLPWRAWAKPPRPTAENSPEQLRQELFSTDERVRLAAIAAVPKLGDSGRGLAWTLIEKLGPEPEAASADRALGAFEAATPILIEGMANPIPTNDLWIAALVLQHNLALHDCHTHFDHLPQIVRV